MNRNINYVRRKSHAMRWVCEWMCGCVQFSHMFNNLCKIHWKIVAKNKIEARKRPIKCHGLRKNINNEQQNARRRRHIYFGSRSEMLGVLTRKRISTFSSRESLKWSVLANPYNSQFRRSNVIIFGIFRLSCACECVCVLTAKSVRSGFIHCSHKNDRCARWSMPWKVKSDEKKTHTHARCKMNSNIEEHINNRNLS